MNDNISEMSLINAMRISLCQKKFKEVNPEGFRKSRPVR